MSWLAFLLVFVSVDVVTPVDELYKDQVHTIQILYEIEEGDEIVSYTKTCTSFEISHNTIVTSAHCFYKSSKDTSLITPNQIVLYNDTEVSHILSLDKARFFKDPNKDYVFIKVDFKTRSWEKREKKLDIGENVCYLSRRSFVKRLVCGPVDYISEEGFGIKSSECLGGDSGSPVFDSQGKLLGIVKSRLPERIYIKRIVDKHF